MASATFFTSCQRTTHAHDVEGRVARFAAGWGSAVRSIHPPLHRDDAAWSREGLPLDFNLSEEQQLLKNTVREFAERELAPHSREWDEKQEFPREVFTKLGELGLMGVVWPAEYGGSGLSTLDYAVVMEELSRVDAGVALSVAAHNSLCSGHIFLAGTEEQKKKFLTPLARGEKVGCWGLTENSAGSDAGGTRTAAVRDGAEWVLNGSKTFITNGRLADTAVVMAVTDR